VRTFTVIFETVGGSTKEVSLEAVDVGDLMKVLATIYTGQFAPRRFVSMVELPPTGERKKPSRHPRSRYFPPR